MANLIKLTGRGSDSWRGAFYLNADKIVAIDEGIDEGSVIYHEPANANGEATSTEVMDTPDEIAVMCAHPLYAVSAGVR